MRVAGAVVAEACPAQQDANTDTFSHDPPHPLLRSATDLNFVFTNTFLWKTAIIVAVSSLPLYIIKFVRQRLNPPAYTKLNMS